jgi:predicted O-methyltransferase YrrM
MRQPFRLTTNLYNSPPLFGIKTKVHHLLGITSIQETQQAHARTLAEISWGQVFDFATRDSEWFQRQQLNPGRWAIGFPAFYVLFRILNDVKPKNILEFGLGESSKMTLQYRAHQKNAQLTIIEQNETWSKLFIQKHPSAEAHIKILPVVQCDVKGHAVNVYDELIPLLKGNKYDLIFIDGPIGSPAYSRYQFADIIEHNLLADDFVMILDDANRPGEKQTLDDAMKLLQDKGIDFRHAVYSGEKDVFLICSPGLEFLTTL